MVDAVDSNQGVADIKPRKPWVAGVLGGLAIGLGHVYTGRFRRAVAFIIISGAIVYPGFLLSFNLIGGVTGLIAPLVLLTVLLGYSVGNAVSLARQARSSYRMKWYN